ncbi:MAG: hypothetical protein RLW61_23895 [Gammaproteobacteria bacterium]
MARAALARCCVAASLLGAIVAAAPARAALELSPVQVTDISALGFGGIGGLAFDALGGELWIADAAGSLFAPGPGSSNGVARIDPYTGVASVSFNAAAAGISLGPDALAYDATVGELYLFSAFRETVAGVTTTAGTPVRTLAIDPRQYAGSAFDASGALWVVDREPLTFEPDFLRRLDPATGAVLASLSIVGASDNPNLSGLAFDPLSGNAIGFDTDRMVLLEIDASSGAVLSETAVGAWFDESAVPGGIAFDASGMRLFLGSGVPLGHPSGIVSDLVVLERVPTAVPLPGGIGLLGTALGLLARRRRR